MKIRTSKALLRNKLHSSLSEALGKCDVWLQLEECLCGHHGRIDGVAAELSPEGLQHCLSHLDRYSFLHVHVRHACSSNVEIVSTRIPEAVATNYKQ